MHARTAACTALLALAALTAGCSSDTTADPAACKSAMEKQFDAAKTGKEGSRPAECDGLDDKTLQKLVGEIAAEQLEKSLGDSLSDLETATP